MSPALAGRFSTTAPPGKPSFRGYFYKLSEPFASLLYLPNCLFSVCLFVCFKAQMLNFVIFSYLISSCWLDSISKSGEVIVNSAFVIHYCNYCTQLYVIWKFHKYLLFLFASIQSIYHMATKVILKKIWSCYSLSIHNLNMAPHHDKQPSKELKDFNSLPLICFFSNSWHLHSLISKCIKLFRSSQNSIYNRCLSAKLCSPF